MMPGFGIGCFDNFGGYGWVVMIINLVIMVVAVVGVAWLLIWVVRRSEISGGGMNHAIPTMSPREILQIRYARGEITREQYTEMLIDLN